MNADIVLVTPSRHRLWDYADALRRGFSPDSGRDASKEVLRALEDDPLGFLADLIEPPPLLIDLRGRTRRRIPGFARWIIDRDDDRFAGAINFRYQPGTHALPDYVSGHVGYNVVAWKRNRGIAKTALRMILDELGGYGLSWIEITCDADNVASRKVIEAQLGTHYVERRLNPPRPRVDKLVFHIPLPKPDALAASSGSAPAARRTR